MPTRQVLNTIFDDVNPIRKSTRGLLTVLFLTAFAPRGHLTVTNMARFCPLHEHTFRPHFARPFDGVAFNQAVIDLAELGPQPCIGVFDCSFIAKSGKHTYGLDRFWSSSHDRPERGLEISLSDRHRNRGELRP